MATGNETPWAVRLSGRDRHEEHRSSTPLELFFDLTFVVAIAAAAANLHHGLAEAHWSNLGGYLVVFWAIWWAWMNFTWFASAYDTNDVLFRALTLVQMAGVLVLAAGVPRALNDGNYDVAVLGYAIMRVAMVAFWLRAARGHPKRRTTCLTYAVGIAVLQLLWIARLLSGGWGGTVSLGILIVGELLVPVVAERRGTTPWHPGHMVERYGLMTIIVLGEVLLATSGAIAAALDEHGLTPWLAATVLGGLLVVFCLWWFYFKHSYEERLAEEETESPFLWGYGHYVIYASVAAVGAGLGSVHRRRRAHHARRQPVGRADARSAHRALPGHAGRPARQGRRRLQDTGPRPRDLGGGPGARARRVGDGADGPAHRRDPGARVGRVPGLRPRPWRAARERGSSRARRKRREHARLRGERERQG